LHDQEGRTNCSDDRGLIGIRDEEKKSNKNRYLAVELGLLSGHGSFDSAQGGGPFELGTNTVSCEHGGKSKEAALETTQFIGESPE